MSTRVLVADSQPVRSAGVRIALEGAVVGDGRRIEVVAEASDREEAHRMVHELGPDLILVLVLMRFVRDEVDSVYFGEVQVPGGFAFGLDVKRRSEEMGLSYGAIPKVLLFLDYEDEEEPEHQLSYTGADGFVDCRVGPARLVEAIVRAVDSEIVRCSL